MKTLSKILFFTIGALCLALAPTAANAQCVQCQPISGGGGFQCVAATSGGKACVTDNGNCALIDACVPIIDRPGTPCTIKTLHNPQVSISDTMIREVAGTDARLAIALINISKIRAEFSVAKINFAPVAYSFDDVENQITQAFDSPYYTQLKRRIASGQAAGGTIIHYDVSITENRLIVTPSDKGSSIEINLERATFGTGKDSSEGYRATSFSIK